MTQADVQGLLTGELQGTWTLDPEATTVRFSHKTLWGLDRQRFGLSWNKIGVIRGLTKVHIKATFRRAR